MFQKIIHLSVHNRGIVLLFVAFLVGFGIYSLRQLPLDAVPDITNNQVQVVTTSPSLAPEEVERFITYPLELSLGFVPGVKEVRSISRFGLSIITVVFEPETEILNARQLVTEQLQAAREDLPSYVNSPQLMPITTGLGEIYQYTLRVDSSFSGQYSPTELRSIQDWIVKRQFTGTEGLVEVSSFGGFLKQYEVAADPLLLRQFDITLTELGQALEEAHRNSGAGLVQQEEESFYIRTEGLLDSPEEIAAVVIPRPEGRPVTVGDLATVQLGHAPRFGAMSMDGEGEVVGGITLMLKGANSSAVIERVHSKVAAIQESLPPGVHIEPYLDRSELVGRTISTVASNLIEGGLIVILVLVLLLGNIRAGLIVASVIPLAMLFAFILMHLLGVSANLMSLGAIDFGIVVDGAVIIVEHLLFVMHRRPAPGANKKFDRFIARSASEIYRAAAFGVLIILVVFIPILSLEGIEGKMFRPMAQTFGFAILGALILSLTYVPALSALAFRKGVGRELAISHRIIAFLQRIYRPVLGRALAQSNLVLGLAALALAGTLWLFSSMGQEFIPQLEEGDMAAQMTLPPGSGLKESLRYARKVESKLLEKFPEVEHVISKIGAAEVPTDPMAVEEADIMIILKNRADWTSAKDREGLASLMKEELAVFAGLSFEFTQPIQLRFNELITGAKTDVAIKIFGEDLRVLAELGEQTEALLRDVPGVGDLRVEQTEGLPQMTVDMDRSQLARYGLSAQEVQALIRTAYFGYSAGKIYEGQRNFDLVARLEAAERAQPDLSKLYLRSATGHSIPLSEVVTVSFQEGPAQISREKTQRRINVGLNVRNRDLASLMEEVRSRVASDLELPAGYFVEFGGEFENLESAKQRLMIAVPIALSLIFVLLYLAFGSSRLALLIFAAVPLSIIGGILALYFRDLPFSISAGVGFITLFGVSVLNGIVLIGHIQELMKEKGMDRAAVVQAGVDRLRPVLITATVATMGFLPMALSTSAGAEVQRPLATVVIGGLVSSTLLTLIVLPVLFERFYLPKNKRHVED